MAFHLLAKCPFCLSLSLRKGDSEVRAFAGCFSEGPSFLPDGPRLCIRREVIFPAPALFGIRQELIIPFVTVPRFLIYCVGVGGKECLSLEDHPLIAFFWRVCPLSLVESRSAGTHSILPSKKGVKRERTTGPGS